MRTIPMPTDRARTMFALTLPVALPAVVARVLGYGRIKADNDTAPPVSPAQHSSETGTVGTDFAPVELRPSGKQGGHR
ncbi:hypothetical protein ACWEKT_32165 [Nocardia takedensis]